MLSVTEDGKGKPTEVREFPLQKRGRLGTTAVPHGLLDEADAHGMLSWRGSGGFSIDASVRIEGEDRAGVERLLRYCARPPFALERLYAPGGIVSLSSPESRLVYRLPRPAPDGRTELVLSPIQLLERLARFIPQLRAGTAAPSRLRPRGDRRLYPVEGSARAQLTCAAS